MTENMTVIRDVDGGYLVPTYVWTDKPGTKAKVMRTLGCIFKRHDWYRKGQERHEFAAQIYEILKQKNAISRSVVVTLPK